MFALTARCARSAIHSHPHTPHPPQKKTYTSSPTDPKDVYAVFRKRSDSIPLKESLLNQKTVTIVTEAELKNIFDQKVRLKEEISGVRFSPTEKKHMWNIYLNSVLQFRGGLVSLEAQAASKTRQELKRLLLEGVAMTESERMKMGIYKDVMVIFRTLVTPFGSRSELIETEPFEGSLEKSGVSPEALRENALIALHITFQEIFGQIAEIGGVNFSKEGIDIFWKIIANKRLGSLQERIAVRMEEVKSQEDPVLRDRLIQEFAEKEALFMTNNAELIESISKTWEKDESRN